MELIFNDGNFNDEVLKSDIPVLVDFYADWCGPCKMMAPVVEKIAEKYAGKVKVGKLNVDASPASAAKYKVMSIPTFLVFKNGEVTGTLVGAVSQAALEAKLL
ncbi:thioredoxin [Anaerobium acetethylicum]|uniref:Thioredoxin n=1 Tax=Anaerobium acetethylicum TaxID=1619234 RepID=A0A1D3TRM0_9FIRM|nr:thioredoxin [Anaerobium acetethylicum]SCP96413.1 thioredoxin 1 [Anaerobium acetethylicum]